MWAIDDDARINYEYKPVVMLQAEGADGHEIPGKLGKFKKYAYEGFDFAVQMVARSAD